MAKVDGTDPTLYMNPSAYSKVKDEKKSKDLNRSSKTSFSKIYDNLLGKTADQIGPLADLPASEEAVNHLIDEVRDAGDTLKNRPLPDEILRYKQAVRNFINYIVQNVYSKEYEEGIPAFLKPGFRGRRGTPEAMEGKEYVKIRVIDKKLEELASMLLSSQARQLELTSRLEEIKGLLIDLLQ